MTLGRQFLFLSVALSITAVCPSPALSQTAAAGPYYATPAWDQTLPSSTRFIVLTNFNSQAVLDRETGLVWQQASGTQNINWFDAMAACRNALTGGRLGWRVPNIDELMTLSVVPSLGGEITFPPGNPFTINLGLFWSATSDPANFANALVGIPQRSLDAGGTPTTTQSKNFTAQVWCVRGPSSGIM